MDMRNSPNILSKAAQIRSQAIPVNVKADKVSPRRNGDSERNSTMSRYVRLESGLWWSLYWVTEQGTVFCQGSEMLRVVLYQEMSIIRYLCTETCLPTTTCLVILINVGKIEVLRL